jgi:hypothetical protein
MQPHDPWALDLMGGAFVPEILVLTDDEDGESPSGPQQQPRPHHATHALSLPRRIALTETAGGGDSGSGRGLFVVSGDGGGSGSGGGEGGSAGRAAEHPAPLGQLGAAALPPYGDDDGGHSLLLLAGSGGSLGWEAGSIDIPVLPTPLQPPSRTASLVGAPLAGANNGGVPPTLDMNSLFAMLQMQQPWPLSGGGGASLVPPLPPAALPLVTSDAAPLQSYVLNGWGPACGAGPHHTASGMPAVAPVKTSASRSSPGAPSRRLLASAAGVASVPDPRRRRSGARRPPATPQKGTLPRPRHALPGITASLQQAGAFSAAADATLAAAGAMSATSKPPDGIPDGDGRGRRQAAMKMMHGLRCMIAADNGTRAGAALAVAAPGTGVAGAATAAATAAPGGVSTSHASSASAGAGAAPGGSGGGGTAKMLALPSSSAKRGRGTEDFDGDYVIGEDEDDGDAGSGGSRRDVRRRRAAKRPRGVRSGGRRRSRAAPKLAVAGAGGEGGGGAAEAAPRVGAKLFRPRDFKESRNTSSLLKGVTLHKNTGRYEVRAARDGRSEGGGRRRWPTNEAARPAPQCLRACEAGHVT